jgi:excisionase family DNA binding protein
MPKDEIEPAGFSVQEVAAYLGCTDDNAYRRIADGSLQAFRIGRRVYVTRQSLADLISLGLDAADPRRKATEHANKLAAADLAERVAEDKAVREHGAHFGSLEGQRERAIQANLDRIARDAADPRTGTRAVRDHVVVLGNRKTQSRRSDGAIDIVPTPDPDPGKGSGIVGPTSNREDRSGLTDTSHEAPK